MAIIGVPNQFEGDDFEKQAFIAEMSSPIPHVLDDPSGLWEAHGVTSQPTMVFVAADGTWERRTGALGPQRLLERLEALAAT